MGFKDLGTKGAAPHVDTPAQAEARAAAVADLKAKTDAKAAKSAAQRDARAKGGGPKEGAAANERPAKPK